MTRRDMDRMLAQASGIRAAKERKQVKVAQRLARCLNELQRLEVCDSNAALMAALTATPQPGAAREAALDELRREV